MTGETTWDAPNAPAEGGSHQAGGDLLSPDGASGAHQPSKRRQYAAGQSQAYYGTPEPQYGGYDAPPQGGGYGGPQAPGLAPGPPAAGGGLFTPGLTGESQFAQQQQQSPQGYGQPAYGQPPPQAAAAGGGAGWYDANPAYPSNPLQGPPGQQQGYGGAAAPAGYGQQGGVGALTDQFSQMGMGGQKPVS